MLAYYDQHNPPLAREIRKELALPGARPLTGPEAAKVPSPFAVMALLQLRRNTRDLKE